MVNGNYKTYVKDDITDDELLTTIGVVGAVGNGTLRYLIFLLRMFWNLLFKNTGYKTVLSVNLIIQIIVYATIRFTVINGGAYLFAVFMINACLGGILVMGPTVAQIIFGQKMGSDIYGFYWEVLSLSNLLQYGFVAGLSGRIEFNGVIYICLAMKVVALFLLNFFNF